MLPGQRVWRPSNGRCFMWPPPSTVLRPPSSLEHCRQSGFQQWLLNRSLACPWAQCRAGQGRQGMGQRGPVVPSAGKPTAPARPVVVLSCRLHRGPRRVQPMFSLGLPPRPRRPIPRASPDPSYSFTWIERALPAGLIKDGESLAAPRLQKGHLSAVRSPGLPAAAGHQGAWPPLPPGWSPPWWGSCCWPQLCA